MVTLDTLIVDIADDTYTARTTRRQIALRVFTSNTTVITVPRIHWFAVVIRLVTRGADVTERAAMLASCVASEAATLVAESKRRRQLLYNEDAAVDAAL